MAYTKKVILVGSTSALAPFLGYFAREGVEVIEVEKTTEVIAAAEEVHPNAVVFVTPRYWDDVTQFIEAFRVKPEFMHTPVIYIGSLIEGEDQIMLQQKGVETLTLGPVPEPEIVRFVVNKIK